MKFNIFFTVRGPGGLMEVPNNTNPMECSNLASLLSKLSTNLPHNPALGLTVLGLKIVCIRESDEN